MVRHNAACCLLFLLIFFCAAASAQIEPCPEEIETLWALEDERQESEQPLVSGMRHGAEAMGCSSADRTFYCTLGILGSDEWPELDISADDENVKLVWADEYHLDSCRDAVRNGTRYEVLAYTDTQYEYIGIVFTGLPLVILDAEDGVEIEEEYAPCTFELADAGGEPVQSQALAHLRGAGGIHLHPKVSYRLELHRTDDKGKDKKNKLSLLGMDADTDWLLLAAYSNTTDIFLRNSMGWDFWNDWNEGREKYFSPLRCRPVELFVRNEYVGTYFLMQRIKISRELKQMGLNSGKSYVFKVIHSDNLLGERPAKRLTDTEERVVELRYAPDGTTEEEAFSKLKDFELLERTGEGQLSDEEFVALAEKCVDVEDCISYFLFLQAASLYRDNVTNNTYIWVAENEDGSCTTRLSPWDFDLAFRPKYQNNTADNMNLDLIVPVRLLDLNALHSREILWKLWSARREGMLSETALTERIETAAEEINASGAYRRESEKWLDGTPEYDAKPVIDYMVGHIEYVSEQMEERWPL